MSKASEPARILRRGLLAGTVMFAMGAMFHWLVPVLMPAVAAMFRPPVFRVWPGWTRLYMIVHPFWFGVAFAWLFTLFEVQLQNPRQGAYFGAILFLVGALPVYIVSFAAICLPLPVLLCWITQGFSQYVLAGAVLCTRRIG
jgi:hypothetical protein